MLYRGEPLLLHCLLLDTDADRDATADADSSDEESVLLTMGFDADIALHLLCRANLCYFLTGMRLSPRDADAALPDNARIHIACQLVRTLCRHPEMVRLADEQHVVSGLTKL